jgi:hypothetical protein
MILLLIIGFSNQTPIYSQASCSCEAFIDPHYEGQIYIYDILLYDNYKIC